ncbi:GntR family transcriptional regulator [Streptomyces sp. NPDC001100]
MGEGRYGSGGRLPAEGELAERQGASRGTVRQAMPVLRTEVLIASRHGTPTGRDRDTEAAGLRRTPQLHALGALDGRGA